MAGRGLHFDGERLRSPPQEEVHFHIGAVRRPVVDVVVERTLLGVGAQQRMNPALEQRPAFLRAQVAELLLHRPNDAWIDPVELRQLAFAHAQLGLERRQSGGEQRVVENVEVALHRGASDAAVAGDAGDVHDLRVQHGRHGEEAHESRQIPHQPFGADLFAQVELRVGVEDRRGFLARPHQRQRAVAQHALQIELRAELGGRKREHRSLEGPPRQQVDARRPQLAGA